MHRTPRCYASVLLQNDETVLITELMDSGAAQQTCAVCLRPGWHVAVCIGGRVAVCTCMLLYQYINMCGGQCWLFDCGQILSGNISFHTTNAARQQAARSARPPACCDARAYRYWVTAPRPPPPSDGLAPPPPPNSNQQHTGSGGGAGRRQGPAHAKSSKIPAR
jgi:hypothetical protein